MKKESGTLISTPYDHGPIVVEATMQCCHCGGMWIVRKGSGKVRGFCLKCMKVTCGKPECDPCVPFEQWLENVEGGKPEDYKPVIVSFAPEAK